MNAEMVAIIKDKATKNLKKYGINKTFLNIAVKDTAPITEKTINRMQKVCGISP